MLYRLRSSSTCSPMTGQVVPPVGEIHVHRRAALHRDQRLLRVEEFSSGLGDGRHADARMELQQDEEDEEKRVAMPKARTEAGNLARQSSRKCEWRDSSDGEAADIPTSAEEIGASPDHHGAANPYRR